jgi:hypothetical protein
MNGRSHQKSVHYVPRPLSADKLIIGPRSKPDNAVQVLSDCDPIELSQLISVVVGLGMCISFTATSDGGAISIVCYDGTYRLKAYGRSENQLIISIRDLLATLRGEG